MNLESVISFPKSSILPKITIQKGELIYIKSDPKFNEFVSEIVGLTNHSKAEVLSEHIGNLKGNDLAKLRQRIALVSSDLYLFEELSLQQNIDNYLSSAKLTAPAQLPNWLKQLHLDPAAQVAKLSAMEKYLARVIICLAKEPALIIVENPYSQLDESIYLATMDIFYELITTKGITFISSFSNEKIRSKFPGRLQELN